MKAQMYFDSKTIGGGGVCRASSSVPDANSITNEEVDGDSENIGRRRVRKFKRVKRIKRGQHGENQRNIIFGEDNQEIKGEMIKEYLCKLQEIVPFSRKDKRLSKLEVITNAIDYIRELRETLGLPPCMSFAEFSQQSTADTSSTQQLPSLSQPTSVSSSPPFYSHIPDNCHPQHDEDDHQTSNGNANEEASTATTIVASENCSSSISQFGQHSYSQESQDTVQGNWGTVRPALWTISVPCNHDSDINSSSMISSTMLNDNMST